MALQMKSLRSAAALAMLLVCIAVHAQTATPTPAPVPAANPASKIPVNYDESNVGTYTLPDPLTMENGQKVHDAKTWYNKRRPEVLPMGPWKSCLSAALDSRPSSTAMSNRISSAVCSMVFVPCSSSPARPSWLPMSGEPLAPGAGG